MQKTILKLTFMNRQTKEIIHYCCAIASLFLGFSLCFIGFFFAPTGEVSDSCLWILGQCFVFAGSVFGITLYVKQEIKKELRYESE